MKSKLDFGLKFLGSHEVRGDVITIPENADFYRLKSGMIRFFKDPVKFNGLIRIPEKAKSVMVDAKKTASYVKYDRPVFYDSNSNVLK